MEAAQFGDGSLVLRGPALLGDGQAIGAAQQVGGFFAVFIVLSSYVDSTPR